MRDFHHTANFTVFGGSYLAESHGKNPMLRDTSGVGSIGPLAAVLVAIVLGATTTAGAITAAKYIHAAEYGFQTAGYIETLGGPSLREVLW